MLNSDRRLDELAAVGAWAEDYYVTSLTILTLSPHLSSTLSSITATHSFWTFPQSQLIRLQLILNSSARAVSKSPKFCHINPVLKSLHCLKIQQRIEDKVISITYKTLQSGQPSYLHSLLTVQSSRATRSSDIITLQRPSIRSRLKVTDRSFTHHAPVLRNFLPKQLQQPSAHHYTRSCMHEPRSIELCAILHFVYTSYPADLNEFKKCCSQINRQPEVHFHGCSVIHFHLVHLRLCLWQSLYQL